MKTAKAGDRVICIEVDPDPFYKQYTIIGQWVTVSRTSDPVGSSFFQVQEYPGKSLLKFCFSHTPLFKLNSSKTSLP
jgi:hypothetical protein